MNIVHTKLGADIHLLELNRPLAAGLAKETVQTFRDISDQGGRRVIVNMEHVPFIDGPGLVALLVGLDIFGGDGQALQLARLQTQPRLLFELTEFGKLFRIADSVAEAVAAAQAA
jgi:anti-anti-sigma regulatory factor